MENKTNDESLKGWARHLFTVDCKTLLQIAEETGISHTNLRLWSEQNNWETWRKSRLTTKEHHIKKMYDLLDQLNGRMKDNAEPNPKDADLMIKYTAAIKNLDTGIDIGHVTEVAQDICIWMRPRDKELSNIIAGAFNDYITHCMNSTA